MLGQYHHLLQILSCVITKTTPPVQFCPLCLLLTTRFGVGSLLCSLTTRVVSPWAGLPSWGAVAGNCLCNPMTTYLYLAEKVVVRICPTQFFLQFQCSESHRQPPERHIGPDSLRAQGGSLQLTGLSTHWKPRSPKFRGCPWSSRDSACSTRPRPVRAAGTVGALMAFRCYSKTGKQAWKV